MKRIFFYFCLLCLPIWVSAQSVLDLQSRATLRKLRNPQLVLGADTTRNPQKKATSSHTQQMVPAMAIITEGTTAADLEREGMQVQTIRGKVALLTLPIDNVECIAEESHHIKTLQLPREVSTKNNVARSLVGADAIHAGSGLPQAYTGKGVVTGIVDGGLDPHHIHFRNPDGTTRVQYLTHIVRNQNVPAGYTKKDYNSATLSRFSTDDSTAFHGTHTLGTMAGGFQGDMQVAEYVNSFGSSISEKPCPFYGMAYESDIVASCGTLQDYFIALGMEGILGYAYDTKKPAVINLSLGSNTGSHDGKGVISQYMAEAGKEAIICVAAGNEGDMPIALTDTLRKDNDTLKTFIYPIYNSFPNGTTTYTNLRYGNVYIYSNDTTPFTVQAVIYNKSRGQITFRNSITPNEVGKNIYYATPGYASDGDKSSTNFATAFEGYVGVGADIDTYSQRYYAIVDYFTIDNTAKNIDGNYILGILVTGKQGQRIDCFCGGGFTTLEGYNIAGWRSGSTNGSISDMACGDNILVVGSYNSRPHYGALDGKTYGYPTLAEGEISAFTSWGETINGKQLPDVCAPGAAVISSLSGLYADYYSLSNYPSEVSGYKQESGHSNYFMQSIGTSMATPVVAGSIALWLEADPTLTISDVKDIIATTATRDAYVTNSIQWGAGKFNAYEGLKEVLRRKGTGINHTQEEGHLLLKNIDSEQVEVFLSGAKSLNIVLYNTAGNIVASYTAMGDELTVNLSNLPAGMYIVQVNGEYKDKLIIR